MSFRDQREHRRNKELKRRYRGKQLIAVHWGGTVIKETNMSIELKIKVKNLADEARTIRTEELKVRGYERWKLQHHRKTVVRDAARRSLIAYQWIRGRDWESCASHHDFTRRTDWREIEKMVKKYGTTEAVASLSKLEAALMLSRSGDYHGSENPCSNAA